MRKMMSLCAIVAVFWAMNSLTIGTAAAQTETLKSWSRKIPNARRPLKCCTNLTMRRSSIEKPNWCGSTRRAAIPGLSRHVRAGGGGLLCPARGRADGMAITHRRGTHQLISGDADAESRRHPCRAAPGASLYRYSVGEPIRKCLLVDHRRFLYP